MIWRLTALIVSLPILSVLIYHNLPAQSAQRSSVQANSQTMPTPPPSASATPQAYYYPNAHIVHNTNNTELESTDNIALITDWYQEQLRSLKPQSTSFIKNDTNGVVTNQLVATHDGQTISVSIQKEANDKTTHITISQK